MAGLLCETQYERKDLYSAKSCLRSKGGIVIIYYASRVKRVMRCNISSATPNDTAPSMSCVWDTVQSSEGEDIGRPRTYSRVR